MCAWAAMTSWRGCCVCWLSAIGTRGTRAAVVTACGTAGAPCRGDSSFWHAPVLCAQLLDSCCNGSEKLPYLGYGASSCGPYAVDANSSLSSGDTMLKRLNIGNKNISTLEPGLLAKAVIRLDKLYLGQTELTEKHSH